MCPKKTKFNNIKHSRVNTVDPKDELADPFLNFGFGVYGYFNFIVIMIFSYSLLSLLALPSLLVYDAATGI